MSTDPPSENRNDPLGGVGRPRPTPEPPGPTPELPQRAHLQRLQHVFAKNPLYFLTCCTEGRRRVLANETSAAILTDAFRSAPKYHGWHVGRYVIMPDHVHLFARPESQSKLLSAFMRDWKKWTAREVLNAEGITAPLWQPEFFDHVLRSAGSYSEKWDYVRNNPVRAGLVATADEWPYAGEITPLSF